MPRIVRVPDWKRLHLLDKWNRREPMTQEQMAALLRVSRATIQNIERQALEKIRTAMEARR